MRVKDGSSFNEIIDTIFYILACILTLGTLWISRVVITIAIRKALENQEDRRV